MTNPNSTSGRLDAIEARLATLVSPGDIAAVTNRVGVLEQRVTALETMLTVKVPNFEAVGARVSELSGAFLTANQRLTAIEEAVSALAEAAPAPAEQRLATVEAALALLSEKVTALAATRGRSGLSGRLASIEEKLNALLPPATPGGTQ